jgi:hypothetical protein
VVQVTLGDAFFGVLVIENARGPCPICFGGYMAQAVGWIIGVSVVASILYAINRRHRWMVENGFAEDTNASGGRPFFVLREFIEPSAENIRHVREVRRHRSEREAPGERPDV